MKNKLLGAIAILLFSINVKAQEHKTIKSGEILVVTTNISAAKVWEVIGAVGGVDKWFAAAIKSCSVKGDKRTCGIEGGKTFDETIELVDHKNRIFRYSIPTQPMMPMQNLSATMQVLEDKNGNGIVVWSGSFDVEVEMEVKVKEMLKGAWAMGVKGIETYVLNNNNTK